MHQLTAVVVAATILVGCAARRVPPDVDAQGVGTAELDLLPSPEPERPAGVAPTRLPPEAAPETVSQALPTYPNSALNEGVTCTAELLYHIETNGSATLVRLTWNLPPPSDHRDAFESAINDAVTTWEFTPGYQLILVERADGTMRYEKRLIPKARRAMIRFRVEGGKGVVE
jgi:hypothetical protein